MFTQSQLQCSCVDIAENLDFIVVVGLKFSLTNTPKPNEVPQKLTAVWVFTLAPPLY